MCNLVEKCCVFMQRQILPPYNLGQNISRQVRYVTYYCILLPLPPMQCCYFEFNFDRRRCALLEYKQNSTLQLGVGRGGGVEVGGRGEGNMKRRGPIKRKAPERFLEWENASFISQNVKRKHFSTFIVLRFIQLCLLIYVRDCRFLIFEKDRWIEFKQWNWVERVT